MSNVRNVRNVLKKLDLIEHEHNERMKKDLIVLDGKVPAWQLEDVLNYDDTRENISLEEAERILKTKQVPYTIKEIIVEWEGVENEL